MIINFRNLMCSGGGGKPAVIEALSVTENGSYTPAEGTDGYAPVEVNVQPALQEKTATTNGEVIADTEFYGLSKVNVQVPIPTFTTEELTATENKVYTPTTDGYSKVTVNVPIKTVEEKKTVSILKNGTTEIVPGTGYDGIAGATINVNVPGAGEEKYHILNGMTFKGDITGFIPSNYNWEYYDNVYDIIGDDARNIPANLYQDIFNELKKYNVKVKVIDLFLKEGIETLDLRGLDLSECYRIYLHCGYDLFLHNVDLSGTNLSNLEVFEIGDYDNELNVNVENCTWGSLIQLDVSGVVKGFNDIDFSKCLYMPFALNDDPDYSKADLRNVKFLGNFYFGDNAKYPAEKIKILSFFDGDSYEFLYKSGRTVIDFSPFDFENIDSLSYMKITSKEHSDTAEEIRNISNVRSPYTVSYCFYRADTLKVIDLSKVNMLGTVEAYGFLDGDNALTDVKFPFNIQVDLRLSEKKLLTKESLLSLISGLYDFGPDGGKTMTIGAENLAKLSPDDINIASGKGWTLQ